jgi:hypothetical protein
MTEPAEDPHENFKGTKPVEERHRLNEAALDAWLAAECRRLCRAADHQSVQGRPIEPDLSAGHAVAEIRAAQEARRQIAALRARSGPRVSRSCRRSIPPAFRSRKQLRALHRRQRSRRHVLRDGNGGRPRALGRRAARNAPKSERRATYEHKIATLAKLHTTDVTKPSASAISASPATISRRQIDRWSKQYKLSETDNIDEMNRLLEWLPQTIPTGRTHRHRPRRLSSRQHGAARKRTARHRRAGLGAFHARRSAGRFHVLS